VLSGESDSAQGGSAQIRLGDEACSGSAWIDQRQEHTFVVHSQVRKRGHRLLVHQKKRKMEAPLVVGEMS
jgi:hypothetical protein